MSSLSTVLTLPSEHLALHETLLPPTPAHRLQAALAGALEEHLLDDPADLHFALLPSAQADCKAGKPVQVLVCNKAWLQGLLDKASSGGARITHIVPDDASLRAAGWDLAQGSFAPRGALAARVVGAAKALGQAPQWRAARVAILLLVVIQIIGINLWAWRDRAALADKKGQINRLLLQTFPETKVVVDAPAQMARATQALRSRSGALESQDLESQLTKLGTGATPTTATSAPPATQIDYTAGTLKLLP